MKPAVRVKPLLLHILMVTMNHNIIKYEEY